MSMDTSHHLCPLCYEVVSGGKRASAIAPAWMRPTDQSEQAGNADLGERPVADIFAGEGLLVHLRAHITRVNPVDTPRLVLRRQDMRELLERRLTRSIATPTFIPLDSRVAGNVEDCGART